MPTQFQNLFNRWIARNYKKLREQMPMHDLMHDAYVTVYCFRRPILPTDERFRSLMSDAYHRHFLKEFNHQMRFTLPDPLFWQLMEERETEVLTAESANNYSLCDLSSNSLKNLFSFVRSHFPPEIVVIFKMAVVEQMSYADIAKATGKSKADIKRIINEVEQAIRQCRRESKSK